MGKDVNKNSSEVEGPPSEATLKKALEEMQRKKKLREEKEQKKSEEKVEVPINDELAEDPHTALREKVDSAAAVLKEAFPEIKITVEYIPAPNVNENIKYAIRLDLTSSKLESSKRSQYAAVLSSQFKELFHSVTPINRGAENKSLTVQFDYEREDGNLVLKESSKKGAENILAKTPKDFRDEFDQALKVKQEAVLQKPKVVASLNTENKTNNMVDDLRKAIIDPDYFDQNRKKLNDNKINWRDVDSNDKNKAIQDAIEETINQPKMHQKIHIKSKEDFLIVIKDFKFDLMSKYHIKASELDALMDTIFDKVKQRAALEVQQSLMPENAAMIKKVEKLSKQIDKLKENLDKLPPLPPSSATAQEKRQYKQNRRNLEEQIRDLESQEKNTQRKLDAIKVEHPEAEIEPSFDKPFKDQPKKEVLEADPVTIKSELKSDVTPPVFEKIEDINEDVDLVEELQARLSEAKERLEFAEKNFNEAKLNTPAAKKAKQQLDLANNNVDGLKAELAEATKELEAASARKVKVDKDKIPEVFPEPVDKRDYLAEPSGFDVPDTAEIETRLSEAKERLEAAQQTFNKAKPNTAAAKKAKQQLDFANNIVEGLKTELAEATKELEAGSARKVEVDKDKIPEVFHEPVDKRDYLAEPSGFDVPAPAEIGVMATEKQHFNLTAAEWQEAEDFFKNNPGEVKFSKKIDGRDPKFNHSFIKVQDEIFAMASRKIAGEEKAGRLGKGSYGKVKMVQAKDGSHFAVKVEGRGARAEDDTETKVMKLIDYVKGEAERDLGYSKKFKGQFTTKKLYTITKLRKGVELFEAVQFDPTKSDRKALTEEQKLRIALGSCTAIQDLHDLGVIHADIKSENFMADINGNQIVIESIDYGTAIILPNDKFEIETGLLVGTPDFMAPEIINRAAYSFASDIYALGVMLKTDLNLYNNIQVKDLIDRMLDENPDNRPEMNEVTATLNNAIILREQVDHLVNVQLNAEDVTSFYVGQNNELTEQELDSVQAFLKEHGYEDAFFVDENEEGLLHITPEAKLFLQNFLSNKQEYVSEPELAAAEELPDKSPIPVIPIHTEKEKREAINELIDQFASEEDVGFLVGEFGLSEKNLGIIKVILNEQGFYDAIYQDEGTFEINADAKAYLEDVLKLNFAPKDPELVEVAELPAESPIPVYTEKEKREAINELIDQFASEEDVGFLVGEFGLSEKNLGIIQVILNEQGFSDAIYQDEGTFEISADAKAHLTEMLNFAPKDPELVEVAELPVESPLPIYTEEEKLEAIKDLIEDQLVFKENVNFSIGGEHGLSEKNLVIIKDVLKKEGLDDLIQLDTGEFEISDEAKARLENASNLASEDPELDEPEESPALMNEIESKKANGKNINIFMLAAAGKKGELIDRLKKDLAKNPDRIKKLLRETDEQRRNALILSAERGSSKTFSAMYELYNEYVPDEIEKYLFNKNDKGMSVIKAAFDSQDENMLKTVLEAAYQYDSEKCKEQIKYIIENDAPLWKIIEEKGALNDEMTGYAIDHILELKNQEYNEADEEAMNDVKNIEVEENVNKKTEENERALNTHVDAKARSENASDIAAEEPGLNKPEKIPEVIESVKANKSKDKNINVLMQAARAAKRRGLIDKLKTQLTNDKNINVFMQIARTAKRTGLIDKLKMQLAKDPSRIKNLLRAKDNKGRSALIIASEIGFSKAFSEMYELYNQYVPDELEKQLFNKNKKRMGVIKTAAYSKDKDMLKTVLEVAYQYDPEKFKEHIKYIIENEGALWEKIEQKGALNNEMKDYASKHILELETARYNEDYEEVVKSVENVEVEKSVNKKPKVIEKSERVVPTQEQKAKPVSVEPVDVKAEPQKPKIETVKPTVNRKELSKSMSFLPSYENKNLNQETVDLEKTEKKRAVKGSEPLEMDEMNLDDSSLVAKTTLKELRPQPKHEHKKPKPKSHMPHYDKKRALSQGDMTEKLYFKFHEKLKDKVFVEEDWESKQKGEKLTFSSLNTTNPKKVSMEPVSNGMRFSGTNGAESDIVRAAQTYEKVNHKAGRELKFEVSAQNPEEAREFMKKLSDGGFDINKITAINCPDLKLQGAELTKLKHDVQVKSKKFDEI